MREPSSPDGLEAPSPAHVATPLTEAKLDTPFDSDEIESFFHRMCRSVEVAPTVWERRPLWSRELRVALPIAYVHTARDPSLPLPPPLSSAGQDCVCNRTLHEGESFGEAGALGGEAEPLTVAASTRVTVLVCPYAALLSELRSGALQTMGSAWRPHAAQRQQRVAQEAARLISQSRAESVASSTASTPREASTSTVARHGSAGSSQKNRSRAGSRASSRAGSRPGSARGPPTAKPQASAKKEAAEATAAEAKLGSSSLPLASRPRPLTGHTSGVTLLVKNMESNSFLRDVNTHVCRIPLSLFWFTAWRFHVGRGANSVWAQSSTDWSGVRCRRGGDGHARSFNCGLVGGGGGGTRRCNAGASVSRELLLAPVVAVVRTAALLRTVRRNP